MIINGLSPGQFIYENENTLQEDEKIQQEIIQQKQEIKNLEQQAEKEKKSKEDLTKFVMSDYHLKELLLIFSSRGNAESIEKLAKLLKKEKELLNKK